jgi:protein CpxP
MIIKNKFFSFLTIVLGITAFSAAAFAQDASAGKADKNKADKVFKGERWGDRRMGRGFGPRWAMRGGMRGMFLRQLDLTDAQKTQIRAIREANKPDPAVMMEMRELRKAKFEGTITPAQEARLNALRDQQIAKMRSVRDQINAVLTAEQRAKIEERKQMMEQRFKERMEKRKAEKAAAPKVI